MIAAIAVAAGSCILPAGMTIRVLRSRNIVCLVAVVQSVNLPQRNGVVKKVWVDIMLEHWG
ncbi:hypothetical protein [Mesorhizobium sp.]|uniref:hypothetical protein n=1 Tax=Mesorhizobium sp. TaxID=1871066 RepID=UPI0025D6CCD2|nr:hypothetical protein [Mesorhizobium sp.]